LSRTLNVEDLDNRAIRHFVARTLRDCLCKQSFKLLEVADLSANMIEMVCRDFANVGAGGLSGRS